MATLHVFNPSHDEALAADTPYYTPTAAARRLAVSYASLPALWASAGDVFLCSDDRLCRCEEAVPFVPDAHFWDDVERIDPWGWDALLVHRLHRLGAPSRLLPTPSQLTALRDASSRLTAVRLLPLVRSDVPQHTVGQSAWCTTEAQVWSAVTAFGGTGVLKSPWSCSGRGVFRADVAEAEVPAVHGRIARVLQRQGAIEVEPFYRREQDFAMEFDADVAGEVCYAGLSCFATSPQGDYGGNLVASEALLRASLPASLHDTLAAVRRNLCLRLSSLLRGRYVGPLGVDMMVVRSDDGELLIHPCVEVNVRRTMGHVAIALRRRLPSPTSRARFALGDWQLLD